MEYILILIAGVAAGFINTVAGGGSLITLPILIFMGLPSATANGTNRVALLAQSISVTINFKNKGYFYPKLILLLGIPAMLGSIVGSNIAINLPDEIFNKILGFVMIVVLLLIITRPEKRFLKNETFDNLEGMRKWIAIIAFFFVGIYGGFIQAGIGFVMIVTLSLITGFSLVKISSIKMSIVMVYTLSALSVFIMNGNVDWGLGILLAVGNSVGGYIGSNFAINKGDKYIRWIITISVIIMAGKLWGFWL